MRGAWEPGAPMRTLLGRTGKRASRTAETMPLALQPMRCDRGTTECAYPGIEGLDCQWGCHPVRPCTSHAASSSPSFETPPLMPPCREVVEGMGGDECAAEYDPVTKTVRPGKTCTKKGTVEG